LNIKSSDIKRGEIWRINFDPTVGTEIRKTRPAVVISSNSIGKLPLKIVAPLTGWQPKFANSIWHVKIEPVVEERAIIKYEDWAKEFEPQL